MKNQIRRIIMLLICLCLWGCGNATEGQTTDAFIVETENGQENSVAEDYSIGDIGIDESGPVKRGDTLEVHYIDVGQGDGILIRQGDAAMLIDAGNNNKGTAVWSYLLSQKIEKLNYAIGTHPDADHIGGMDVVLYKMDCDAVFLPACDNETKTYEELIQTIGQRSMKVTVPKKGETYSLGSAQFQILTDTDKNYGDNTNDYSITLRIVFGDTSFLFTGDAEEVAEQDMLASGLTLQSDVYKAAHHGADTANTEAFLTAVNPTYCVISCGEDNSYGHPRAGVLNQLRAMGVKVFRTDEQGTIVATSDGEHITWNTSPSESWKAGEPIGSDAAGDDKTDTDKTDVVTKAPADEAKTNAAGSYILNTNTKKFHRPTCSSVKRMSDSNKIKSNASREELMQEGYEPCKNCNP